MQLARRCVLQGPAVLPRPVGAPGVRASGTAAAAAAADWWRAPTPALAPDVVTVHFVDPNVDFGPPRRHTIQAPVGSSLVDVARANGVSIDACCGQKLQCATCHVILSKDFYGRLPAPGNRESDMLETAFTLTETSRLGCQVSLTKDLDGIECTLPDSAAKGLVRMPLHQPRQRVHKQWTSLSGSQVPAVPSNPRRVAKAPPMRLGRLGALAAAEPAARSSASNAAAGGDAFGPSVEALEAQLEEQRRQLQEQRDLAARLEAELRQLRGSSARGDPEGAGRRLRAAAAATGSSDSSAGGGAAASDGDKEDSGLEKIKAELQGTRLDPARMGRRVGFDDVIGLEQAKRALREAVIWPAVADEALFTGIRANTGGLLLYGPPGCGKTMLARAAAAELGEKVAFFHVRPGDVMSKFYGDSQRRVAALEELVQESAPAVVFFDEVDSLLGSRDGGGVVEHHRATTNALLAWMDGFGTGDERVFFLGATNRAEAIDEAALRRFGDAAEVETPGLEARLALLRRLVFVKAADDGHLTELSEEDLQALAERTEGFSLADLDRLVRRAFLAVLRQLPGGVQPGLQPSDVPPVTAAHFEAVMSDGGSTMALREMLRKRGEARTRL